MNPENEAGKVVKLDWEKLYQELDHFCYRVKHYPINDAQVREICDVVFKFMQSIENISIEVREQALRDRVKELEAENKFLRGACVSPGHVDDFLRAKERIEWLESERKRLTDCGCRSAIKNMNKERFIHQVLDRVDRLIALLKRVEWKGWNYSEGRWICPICGGRQKEGHAPDCEWKKEVGG